MEKDNEAINNKPDISEGQSSSQAVPIFSDNIEKVLLKAAIDEKFKNALFQDRKSALETLNLPLTQQDKFILESIPISTLMSTIANIIKRFTEQRSSRRVFFKYAAAGLGFAAGAYIGDYFLFPIKEMLKVDECKKNIREIKKALRIYAINNSNKYPVSLEFLAEINPLRNEPYINIIPVCPLTRRPYTYTCQNSFTKYTLKCNDQERHIVPWAWWRCNYQLTAGIR